MMLSSNRTCSQIEITKPTPGSGLSTAYETVKKYGEDINVTSKVGEGTMVTIRITVVS